MCITPLLPVAHRAGGRVTWLKSQWKLSVYPAHFCAEIYSLGPLTGRLRRQLLELRNLLFLEYAYNDDWGDEAGLALLESDDPVVPEICLLADGLEQALQDAGVVGTEDTQAA